MYNNNDPKFDDTQPNRQSQLSQKDLTSDTVPFVPKRGRFRLDFVTSLLVLVIGMTMISLLATIFLANITLPPATPTPMLIRINLIQDGVTQSLTTKITTVDELLQTQGIIISEEDALSVPPQTLLMDNMTITIGRAQTVTVTIDGISRTLRTPFKNPFDILTQANIVLQDTDRIWLDGIPTAPGAVLLYPEIVTDILIQRSQTVTIDDDGTLSTVTTVADTVGDALAEANIILQLADSVQPDINATLSPNTTITITRSIPVQIQVDGTTIDTQVGASTVGEALASAGIVLSGLDYVIPMADTPITPNMRLQVVRIHEDLISVEEPIPYETVFQADDTLELDQRAVVQAGQNGIQRIDFRVRYADGVEIGREPGENQMTQAPVNEVIAYGTQIVLRTIDTPEGTREYWRSFRAYATSYHPAALGGDDVTAIGETLRTGIIAADPKIIPYRTDVFIPGYGNGYMADTGGARSSPYWVDLGYSDEDWRSWSRYVDVYLLTPVPANLNYLLPAWIPIRGQTPP